MPEGSPGYLSPAQSAVSSAQDRPLRRDDARIPCPPPTHHLVRRPGDPVGVARAIAEPRTRIGERNQLDRGLHDPGVQVDRCGRRWLGACACIAHVLDHCPYCSIHAPALGLPRTIRLNCLQGAPERVRELLLGVWSDEGWPKFCGRYSRTGLSWGRSGTRFLGCLYAVLPAYMVKTDDHSVLNKRWW